MSKTYLGVDIGGTAVKLGLVDENGRVLRRAERSVSFDGYKTPILDTVQAAIHEFLTADAPRLEGIAVSATGQIDSRRGVVAGTCGNFPGWIGVDIKGTLERAFGLPVTVANDANCMLLGEVWAGAAKGYTDVIGVTLGTGVGGGILTGGRLLEGARGLGGELGHFRLHALDGAMSATPPQRRWSAAPRRPGWTRPTGVRFLRLPPRATPARWLCSTAGSTRSPRALRALYTSSTRS